MIQRCVIIAKVMVSTFSEENIMVKGSFINGLLAARYMLEHAEEFKGYYCIIVPIESQFK